MVTNNQMRENMSNFALRIEAEIDKYGDMENEDFQKIKGEFLGLIDKNRYDYIFDLKTVCSWSGVSKWFKKFCDDKYFKHDFYENKLNGLTQRPEKDNKNEYDYEITDGMPFFSIDGFKKFSMRQENDKSNAVREYFVHIEACYYKILGEPDEEVESELKWVMSEIERLEDKSTLLKIANETKLYEEQNIIAKENLKKLFKLDIATRDVSETDALYEYLLSNYIEQKETTPQSKYKQVPVYVVDINYIDEEEEKLKKSKAKAKKPKAKKSESKSTKLDIFSSSTDNKDNDDEIDIIEYNTSENIEYEMPYNFYSTHTVKSLNDDGYYNENENPLLFYYIGNLAYKMTTDNCHKITSFRLNTDQLKEIKNILDEKRDAYSNEYAYKTNFKSVYLMSFGDLEKIKNEVIQASLFEEFADIKNLQALEPYEF